MCTENIKEMIDVSDKFVMKSILYVYQNQTTEEQICATTNELNGKGFNGVDAPFLSSLAEQIKAKGFLTSSQIASARKVIKKYIKQIQEAIEAGIQVFIPSFEPKIDKPVTPEAYTRVEKNRIIKKIPVEDVTARGELKRLKFNFDGRTKEWSAPDNAINRLYLGMNIDTPLIPEVDFEAYPSLREYQKEDVEYMVAMGSCLNANEMGLGKTFEAIVYLQNMEHNKVLIVCPKSLIHNWKRELIKWNNVPVTDISIIEGTKTRKLKVLADLQQYVIVNYETMRTPYILEALKAVNWDVTIADEAHRIKNKDSIQSKAISSIKSKHRVGLTGTPVQNRPNDLWNLLHWINPYYSSNSYWKFVDSFCETYDNGYGITIAGLTKDERSQHILNDLLQYTMVRHEKSEVLKDLPPKIPHRIDIQPTSKQEKLYKQVKTEIMTDLDNGENITISNALTRLLRLQQITSNPELFGLEENPKFDAAMDILDGTSGKVIFFSRFEKTISAFEEKITKAGYKSVKLVGGAKDRDGLVQQFQNDPETKVFLGTIKAAGEGLTLTAADQVVFFDREWSPAMNQQAEDRAHRIGQLNTVQVTDLICEGTIDGWVEKVLGKKLDDITKLMG